MKDDLTGELEGLGLAEGLRRISEYYPGQAVFSSSFGQEDMVITDTLFRENIPIDAFTLDTGRLFQETYDLMDLTRARYGKEVRIYFPAASDVETYVSQKGINAFYETVENRKACCFIRKVKPLKRALQGRSVWITGLRAEQSDNRNNVPIWEWDADFGIYKYNPLIHWSYEEVLSYLKKYSVPYNKLHDKGFISIGCAPCTRAIQPGEHPRAGRWWWEDSKKECGLHSHESVAAK